MPGTECNKGFTLVELLLAMAISGFVALVGYQGLSVAVDASSAVEEESRRLADLQLALGILEEDVSQIIARPVRNELGGLDPIMSGGLSNESLLQFTRDGWHNPRMLRRSELARINYQWRGDNLIRQRWAILDRISLEEGLEEVILLAGVEDVRVEFYTPYTSAQDNMADNESALMGEWADWWSSERIGLDTIEPLPPAVRITLTITGFGQISRVITLTSA